MALFDNITLQGNTSNSWFYFFINGEWRFNKSTLVLQKKIRNKWRTIGLTNIKTTQHNISPKIYSFINWLKLKSAMEDKYYIDPNPDEPPSGYTSVQSRLEQTKEKNDCESKGYTWGRNTGDYEAHCYDCSSLVATGLIYAGFTMAGSTSTRTLRNQCVNQGFQWIQLASYASSNLQPGDILLNEGTHTQVYIGDEQDVSWSWHNNYGIRAHNDNASWDGILRYVGD